MLNVLNSYLGAYVEASALYDPLSSRCSTRSEQPRDAAGLAPSGLTASAPARYRGSTRISSGSQSGPVSCWSRLRCRDCRRSICVCSRPATCYPPLLLPGSAAVAHDAAPAYRCAALCCAVLAGDVQMQGLRLRADALRSLGFPIVVKGGSLRTPLLLGMPATVLLVLTSSTAPATFAPRLGVLTACSCRSRCRAVCSGAHRSAQAGNSMVAAIEQTGDDPD